MNKTYFEKGPKISKESSHKNGEDLLSKRNFQKKEKKKKKKLLECVALKGTDTRVLVVFYLLS